MNSAGDSDPISQFIVMGLREFLNHPAGPKTIHFWAPAMKWGLVIAGLADINRPAANISVPQTLSLTATGLIWARYSTQIIPLNYNLMTVNLFVAGTGLYQLARIAKVNFVLLSCLGVLGSSRQMVTTDAPSFHQIPNELREIVKKGFRDPSTKFSKDAQQTLCLYFDLFLQEIVKRTNEVAQKECASVIDCAQIESILARLLLDF